MQNHVCPSQAMFESTLQLMIFFFFLLNPKSTHMNPQLCTIKFVAIPYVSLNNNLMYPVLYSLLQYVLYVLFFVSIICTPPTVFLCYSDHVMNIYVLWRLYQPAIGCLMVQILRWLDTIFSKHMKHKTILNSVYNWSCYLFLLYLS